MTLLTATWDSPVGPLQAIASDAGLCFLEYDRPERKPLIAARLARWHGSPALRPGTNAHLAAAQTWLARYFAGESVTAEDLRLDVRGTAFEQAVWAAMRDIRHGSVESYASLALRLGKPRNARAVGGASRRNPVSIIVPCHRVVGSGGALTGYGGGLAQKAWLLTHEGFTHAAAPTQPSHGARA